MEVPTNETRDKGDIETHASSSREDKPSVAQDHQFPHDRVTREIIQP